MEEVWAARPAIYFDLFCCRSARFKLRFFCYRVSYFEVRYLKLKFLKIFEIFYLQESTQFGSLTNR